MSISGGKSDNKEQTSENAAMTGSVLTGGEAELAANNLVEIDGEGLNLSGGIYTGGKGEKAENNTALISGKNCSLSDLALKGGDAENSLRNHVLLGDNELKNCLVAANSGKLAQQEGRVVMWSADALNTDIYGALAEGSPEGYAEDNIVYSESSVLSGGSVYGGKAPAYAFGNDVILVENTAKNCAITGGSSENEAQKNKVFIFGGDYENCTITGGEAENAIGNAIVIKDGAKMNGSSLYGGIGGNSAGNTLELWTPVTVKEAGNFQNYRFIVPQSVIRSSNFMLSVSNPVDLKDAKIGIGIQNGVSVRKGDLIHLISRTRYAGKFMAEAESLDETVLDGGTLFTAIKFSLIKNKYLLFAVAEADGDGKLRTLSGDDPAGTKKMSYLEKKEMGLGIPDDAEQEEPAGKAREEAKAPVEAQAAAMALLADGQEFAAGRLMDSAEKAAEADAEAGAAAGNGTGLAAFSAAGGGWSRYETGSHVNMSSVNFAVGLAKKIDLGWKDLTIGAFFETGGGKFTTHNSFNDEISLAGARGEGHSRFFGGGVLLSLTPRGGEGLYAKASGRAGGISAHWKTDDIAAQTLSYKTSRVYYGAHAGLGYKGRIGQDFGYDVYGNLYWTHLDGKNADILGERFRFKKADSLRTRFGTRVSYDGWQSVKPFAGAAWEREYLGTDKATVNGLKTGSPTLKGDTGVLELGLSIRPGKNSNWQIDLRAEGFAGARKGVSGQAQFTLKF